MGLPHARRLCPRVASLLRVDYSAPAELLADYLTDLSEEGLFIRTDMPFDLGQELQLAIGFPGLLDPVDVVAAIRWRSDKRGDAPGKGRGVGCQLSFGSAAQRCRIADLIRLLDASGIDESVVDPLTPLRVLVVDEDRSQSEAACDGELLVQTPDVGVSRAHNAIRALDLLDTGPFDLAVVDYFLPGMNGADLIQHLRGDPRLRNMAIVATAALGGEARWASMRAGADLFVDKPFPLHTLARTLGRLRISPPSQPPAPTEPALPTAQ